MEPETKWFVIVTFTVLFILVIGTIIFVKTQIETEYPQSPTENCNTLKYNSPEAIDIVYLSSKEDAEKYSSFFFQTNPFTDIKEDFNIYYVLPPEESLSCETYKGIASFCYSEENVKLASACSVDYIVAIVPGKKNLRSSAYLNFASINSNHQKSVQTHELGHTIAGLAEEYINRLKPKGPNCVSNRADFNNLEEGFFKGCSLEKLFRSTEFGVMRTLNSNEYGAFNEEIMKREIEETKKSKSSISGFAIHEERDCSKENYYLISLILGENNYFDIKSKSLETGCASDAGAGDEEYTIFSREGKQIQQGDLNLQIFTDIQLEDSEILSGEVYSPEEIILAIPKRQDDFSLIVSQENQEIANVDLYKIGATTCNE